MIFLQADLSNAENRVCLVLTRDAEMIRLARSKPHELDMHSQNVTAIFGKTPADVTAAQWKEMRHLGKVVSHGAQRGMRGNTLSENILRTLGLAITPGECERHIDAYLRTYAPVKDYFRDIRHQVVKRRVLTNTWGRMLWFTHDALDDEGVFQEALSFPMQSEIADLMNQWGFLPTYHHMMRRYGRPPNTQTHDSLLLSVPWRDAWDMAHFIKRHLERPRIYYGEALTIPVDISLGSSWAVEFEFKQMPSRLEFDEAAMECERRASAQAA